MDLSSECSEQEQQEQRRLKERVAILEIQLANSQKIIDALLSNAILNQQLKKLDINSLENNTNNKPKVGKKDQAKRWILANPPELGESTSEYFQKYKNSNLESLTIQKFTSEVIDLGYKKLHGKVNYWTNSNTNSQIIIDNSYATILPDTLPDDESDAVTYCVYFITEVPFNERVKIGKTNNLSRRLGTLQTGSPTHLDVINTISVATKEEMNTLELDLHRQFKEKRLHGEWFQIDLEQVNDICNHHKNKQAIINSENVNNKKRMITFSDKIESAKEWIRMNPPNDKEVTTDYYNRYAKANQDALYSTQFGKVVSNCGFHKRNSGISRYWIKT